MRAGHVHQSSRHMVAVISSGMAMSDNRGRRRRCLMVSTTEVNNRPVAIAGRDSAADFRNSPLSIAEIPQAT